MRDQDHRRAGGEGRQGHIGRVEFALAPDEKWPLRAFFDYARTEAEAPKPEPAKPAKAEPAATSFDDLEDAWA